LSAAIVTATKVVDTSAVAALLFGEPDAEDIARRLSGASLTAPALMPFELANVCLIKCKRNPEQASALRAALALCDRLGVKKADVDQDAVVDLALASGLTAYDASYLWLARRLGAELVTLDRALARAAAQL
jgi:predicted nucleic acid-binding protein